MGIMSNGKLGFTRELYDYYFDYTLPVGEKVNIKIVTQQQVTKLYVNGQFVSNATGEFNHNGTNQEIRYLQMPHLLCRFSVSVLKPMRFRQPFDNVM